MTNPVLYIMAPTNLASLNAGKLSAQTAHASNKFVHKVMRLKRTHPIRKLYDKWAKQAGADQGFGTTIVLAGTIADFEDATQNIESNGGVALYDPVIFGVVHDPTYPIRDGEVTHLIPLDTCAYFFCDKALYRGPILDFPLYP